MQEDNYQNYIDVLTMRAAKIILTKKKINEDEDEEEDEEVSTLISKIL